jgi:hypothetical protein
LLVPVGVWLVMRLLPPHVLAEARAQAAATAERPVGRRAAIVIMALWVTAIVASLWLAWRWRLG